MADHRRFCDALTKWASLVEDEERAEHQEGQPWPFRDAWRTVHTGITKSCLLDRMLNGDEQPSLTPCPVHKGHWRGIHMWGSRKIDGKFHVIFTGLKGEVDKGPEHEGLAEWRAAGCRCFQHRCGCTTGWQPDEACGCATRAE